MRHEIILNGMVITTDNSAAIGQKRLDAVKAPDPITAKFAARVALLEQWAAGSEPQAVLLHNFSGAEHWEPYVAGIEELFYEAGLPKPSISGSSETNMQTLQSALAVTMIGRQEGEREESNLEWVVYGEPLTGKDVLENPAKIADLKKLNDLMKRKLIHRIWPVGSKGIAAEVDLMLNRTIKVLEKGPDLLASGGPATSVLLGTMPQNTKTVMDFLESPVYPVYFDKI
ncbi:MULTISPECIES: alpha-ribazole-5-phosphate synthase [Planomicrobium]|uniref:Alpha-ribazole-5-phosphate synthase n=1 Tax=Planomicrobium okeanokoites TaxID=244 RepID=A0ABV7KMB8_PLAOK|nr:MULTISPECIES: alpha-ribazole-5-phosphate synthase [Planomicrobium]